MYSIPQVMIWEQLSRGRWNLLLVALAANLIPAWLAWFIGISQFSETERDFVPRIVANFVLCNSMGICVAIMTAQGKLSRFYAYPVKTSTLVSVHLLTAFALLAAEISLNLIVINRVCQLQWPILGPTLCMIAIWAACQAAFWIGEKTAWLPLAMTAVGASLGTWYLSRFTAIFGPARMVIPEITPVEAMLLLIAVAVSWSVGWVGVARDRCGQPLESPRLQAWLRWLFDVQLNPQRRFASAEAAQYWIEWVRKGWGLPIIVAFGHLIALLVWTINNRNPRDLLEGTLALGALMSVGGAVVGFLLGNTGEVDDNFQMTQFMATRPMTNHQFARILLQVAARTVLLGWLVWALLFAVTAGLLLSLGLETPQHLLGMVRWWWLPASLLGCWTTVSVIMSAMLTGRGRECVVISFTGMTVYIAFVVATGWLLSFEARTNLYRSLAVLAGIALCLATLSVFAMARRRGQIPWKTVSSSAIAWLVVAVAILFEWNRDRLQPISIAVFVIGLASLMVLPFAAAPLAIGWNRAR